MLQTYELLEDSVSMHRHTHCTDSLKTPDKEGYIRRDTEQKIHDKAPERRSGLIISSEVANYTDN